MAARPLLLHSNNLYLILLLIHFYFVVNLRTERNESYGVALRRSAPQAAAQSETAEYTEPYLYEYVLSGAVRPAQSVPKPNTAENDSYGGGSQPIELNDNAAYSVPKIVKD